MLLQYYREKIKAEAEGRTYVAPPPSKAAPSKPAGMTRNARSFGNSGWDDWGDEGSRPTKVSYFFPHGHLHLLFLSCRGLLE